MNEPLVSIIIPTYNRAHIIGETLDSIIVQTYTNWECLVVDDGSTDNTYQVVKKYEKKDDRLKLYSRPSNKKKGANTCRNYGFELSKGEFVNWFDDDDIMFCDFLFQKITNIIEKNLDYNLCSYNVVDSTNNLIEKRFLFHENNIFRDYVKWDLKIITHSLMIKKSVLSNFKLFSPDIKRGQEFEFFSRLFFEKPLLKYEIINKQLFNYRQHDNSKSFKAKTYNSSYIFSEVLIQKNNLGNAISIKDKELISYTYERLIHLWFISQLNKDFEITKRIEKKILEVLVSSKSYYYLKLIFFCNLFLPRPFERVKLLCKRIGHLII